MILGFDFGTKKIGVALGQHVTQSASPLCLIKAINGEPDWPALIKIMDEWRPIACVVGLALNLDMSESKTSKLAKSFGEKLHNRFNIEVHYVDEHLTSFEARLISKSSKKSSASVDALAAALILESWLKEGGQHVGKNANP